MSDKEQIPQDFHDHNEIDPLPTPNWANTDEWLPKTDWSRDGIIASDD